MLDDTSGIERAEYYVDGVLLETAKNEPFNWHMNIRAMGTHNIEVKTHDCAGNTMTITKKITIYAELCGKLEHLPLSSLFL